MTDTTAEAAGPVLTRQDAPAAFHVMAKPTGAVCNLDCAYCFFLSKEMLYPGSRFRMADDLLETYIRQLVEAHASSPFVPVAWPGGDPVGHLPPPARRGASLLAVRPRRLAGRRADPDGRRLLPARGRADRE